MQKEENNTVSIEAAFYNDSLRNCQSNIIFRRYKFFQELTIQVLT
jgi:hypothetical protein